MSDEEFIDLLCKAIEETMVEKFAEIYKSTAAGRAMFEEFKNGNITADDLFYDMLEASMLPVADIKNMRDNYEKELPNLPADKLKELIQYLDDHGSETEVTQGMKHVALGEILKKI